MFLLVLLCAGGDDVIAVATGTSVIAIRTVLRILVFVAPAVAAVVAYWACVIVRRRCNSHSHASQESVATEIEPATQER